MKNRNVVQGNPLIGYKAPESLLRVQAGDLMALIHSNSHTEDEICSIARYNGLIIAVGCESGLILFGGAIRGRVQEDLSEYGGVGGVTAYINEKGFPEKNGMTQKCERCQYIEQERGNCVTIKAIWGSNDYNTENPKCINLVTDIEHTLSSCLWDGCEDSKVIVFSASVVDSRRNDKCTTEEQLLKKAEDKLKIATMPLGSLPNKEDKCETKEQSEDLELKDQKVRMNLARKGICPKCDNDLVNTNAKEYISDASDEINPHSWVCTNKDCTFKAYARRKR